jgi:hypothetical protein
VCARLCFGAVSLTAHPRGSLEAAQGGGVGVGVHLGGPAVQLPRLLPPPGPRRRLPRQHQRPRAAPQLPRAACAVSMR